jgi:putative transposase
MSKDTGNADIGAIGSTTGLEELIREGARSLIQQAIEVEVQQLLENCQNVALLDGRRAVVRNGYLPQREILTAVGALAVRVPKVRDRSGSG